MKRLLMEKIMKSLKEKKTGTKFRLFIILNIEAKQSETIYLRLTNKKLDECFPKNFEEYF